VKEHIKEKFLIAGIIVGAFFIVWMFAAFIKLFSDPLADRKPKSQMILNPEKVKTPRTK
jgi:hypothetical protein